MLANHLPDEYWKVVFIVIQVKPFTASLTLGFVNYSVLVSPRVREGFALLYAAYMWFQADVRGLRFFAAE